MTTYEIKEVIANGHFQLFAVEHKEDGHESPKMIGEFEDLSKAQAAMKRAIRPSILKYDQNGAQTFPAAPEKAKAEEKKPTAHVSKRY